MRSFVLMCVLSAMPLVSGTVPAASAQTSALGSPVGRWKAVDDVSGKVKSIVEISEQNGKLSGRVLKLVDPDAKDPNPKCQDCSGEQKGKPVVGLRILWEMKKDGDQWSGGSILDPATGKVYKCLLSLEDGGSRLKVRGFIGFSLLGRTQEWSRE